MEKWEFKKIKLADMMEYIDTVAPATVSVDGKEVPTKAWFKALAFDEKGKYQHLIAVRAFCAMFMPEIIPVAKVKVVPVDAKKKLADW